MDERIACLLCDLPVTVGELEPGERARCPRCGHLLASCVPDALSRSLALAVAGLVLLLLANAFPFMALEASGLEKVMTLPATAVELHEEGYAPLALLVFGVIVVVPALTLSTVVALVVPLLQGRGATWLVPAGRFLFVLGPWNMVEVFIIGVIVSLVKIVHLAHVEIGFAFWAYAGFVLCFIATLSSLDKVTLWREIERCTS